jgi:hypothetical protein
MSRPIEKPAEFFVDRSLGKSIVEGLRDAGLTVHSMADIYGERRAQLLADEVWLRDAGKNDWIVLTKDDAIRRRPAERDALTEAAVRAFCLTNRKHARRRADQAIRLKPPPNPPPSPQTWPIYLRCLRERLDAPLA